MKRSTNKFTQKPPIEVGEVEKVDGKMQIRCLVKGPEPIAGEWLIIPSISPSGELLGEGVLMLSGCDQRKAGELEKAWRPWVYRQCGFKFKAAIEANRGRINLTH